MRTQFCGTAVENNTPLHWTKKMQLTGTIQNRIADAIEFLKANRTEAYDHNQIADVYERAGVPFTEAADSFFKNGSVSLKTPIFITSGKKRISFIQKERSMALIVHFTYTEKKKRSKRFTISLHLFPMKMLLET